MQKEEFKLRESDEFIKLGQLLKATAFVSSGVEAKFEIQDGNVMVNGEVCTMRGKKIHPGDLIRFQDREIEVIS